MIELDFGILICIYLVVAFLLSLLESAAGSADLNWQLLAPGVSNKLTGLLLNILGGTG